jgi:hypothetical protein
METEFVPQGIQGPDIPKGKRRLKAHLAGIAFADGTALGA